MPNCIKECARNVYERFFAFSEGLGRRVGIFAAYSCEIEGFASIVWGRCRFFVDKVSNSVSNMSIFTRMVMHTMALHKE